MDTEIVIIIGDKKSVGNKPPQWVHSGIVRKTTGLTSNYVPSLEDATKMFADAYKEALSDVVRGSMSKVVK